MPARTIPLGEDQRTDEQLQEMARSPDACDRLVEAMRPTMQKVARLMAAKLSPSQAKNAHDSVGIVQNQLVDYLAQLRHGLRGELDHPSVVALSNSWTERQRDILAPLFGRVFDLLEHEVGRLAMETVEQWLPGRPGPSQPRRREGGTFGLDADHLFRDREPKPDDLQRLILHAAARAMRQKKDCLVLYVSKADRQAMQSRLEHVSVLMPQSREGHWRVRAKTGEIDFRLEEHSTAEVPSPSDPGEVSPEDFRDLDAILRGEAV